MHKKELFGYTKDNEPVSIFTLSNDFLTVKLLDIGCAVQSLYVNTKDGLKDVVLGYDNVCDYEKNEPYFGVVVGRCANRISNASFELDGKVYNLPKNDGENNLHSGGVINKKIWQSELKENSVIFTTEISEREDGFPKNIFVEVEYTLDKDGLIIDYKAHSDGTTLCNFTNHSYFNVDGHESGSIEKQKVMINADYYTPINENSIPFGKNESVENSIFDFRALKEIGKHWDDENEQIKNAGGYDHNFVINGNVGELRNIASVVSKQTGIKMNVFSTMAGVQLYTGNFLTEEAGKGGILYKKRYGLCLETQYYPDAINNKQWHQPVIHKDDVWESRTIYRFEVE